MRAGYIVILLFLSKLAAGQPQHKDSLHFVITRVESAEKENDVYEVRVLNGQYDPICIMFSIRINLIEEPPQRLTLWKMDGDVELFSLHSAVADTSLILEGENTSYNGEILLPTQQIAFRVVIPRGHRTRRMQMEYISVPDLRYRDFMQSIFKNTDTWYAGYKRRTVLMDIPFN